MALNRDRMYLRVVVAAAVALVTAVAAAAAVAVPSASVVSPLFCKKNKSFTKTTHKKLHF